MKIQLNKNISLSELKKLLGSKVIDFNHDLGNNGIELSDEVYLASLATAIKNNEETFYYLSLVYKVPKNNPYGNGHRDAWVNTENDVIKRYHMNKIKSFDTPEYGSWNFDFNNSNILVQTIETQLEFDF